MASGHTTNERFKHRLSARPFAIGVLFLAIAVFIAPGGYVCPAAGQDTFYSVQAGSFKKFENAARALAHYQKMGLDAFCRYRAVEGQGHWFRIYVGRFGSKSEAEQTARQLMKEVGDSGVLVKKVEEPPNPYYLHVGSYVLKSQAELETRQRVKYLLEPFFKEEFVSGQRWFRVYVGPFANAEDAAQAGARIKEQGMISYFRPVRMDKGATVSDAPVRIGQKEPLPSLSKDTGDQSVGIEISDQGDAKGGELAGRADQPEQRTGPAVQQHVESSEAQGIGSSLNAKKEAPATADLGAFRETVKQAETLMAQGKPAEAFALLAPLEADLAGNMDYDYLLAIAALDSGDPAKASLVFERILAVRPEFAGARLDMARAYYALGNFDQAKTEFEAVLKLNPPSQAKAVTEQYLAAIEKAAETKGTTLSGYMEATIGYDDNVNNSTDQNEVYVPAFAVNMALAPTNVQAGDTYGSLAGGASLQHYFKPELLSYLDVDGNVRRNSKENAFDLDVLGFRGGLRFVETRDSFRIGLRAERSWLDGDSYRDTMGLETDWRHLVNPQNQLVLFGQYNQNRYEEYDINDVDQVIGGGSWLHAVAAPRKPILFSSAYVGSEADKNNRADGGKVFYGMRVGGQMALTEKTCLFANMGGQYGDYDSENPSFLETREDWQFDARLGLNWGFKPDWTLKPQIVYSKNTSNIELYEYDRTDISLTIRRDFH